ncbi:MAG: hypothetical protein IT324_28945 [Anaerolineae bacterium]|nr:hypothetical protein [Anaerolineae bacterium]
MKTVAGLCNTMVQSRKAIEHLRAEGFDTEAVSVVGKGSSVDDMKHSTDTQEAVATTSDSNVENRPNTDVWLPNQALATSNVWSATAGETDLANVPDGDLSDNVRTTEIEQGATSDEFPKALHGWGFAKGIAREFQSGVRHGRVFVAIEIIENEAAFKAAEVLRQEGFDHITISAE